MKANKILSVMFLMFIGTFFVLNTFSADKEFSEKENRVLAQKPEFSVKSLVSGEFTRDYETYITDQFIGRDLWVTLKFFTEKGIQKIENNGVYFGSDDYFFSKFVKPDEKRLSGNLESIQKLIDKNPDVPVSFSLVPTSAHVLRDKLPKHATPYDQSILLNRAAEMYPEHYYDIEKEMMANKITDLYYRTDHHWTSDGAYIAYNSMCEQMGIEPTARGEVLATYPDFYGTLYTTAGASGGKSDTVVTYTVPEVTVTDIEGTKLPLYDESYRTKKDKYSVFLGGNHPLLKIENENAKTDEKLLIIKDSFSNALLPYMTDNFSEIHVWDLRFNNVEISKYVKENAIDKITVLYSTENFASDANLFKLGK